MTNFVKKVSRLLKTASKLGVSRSVGHADFFPSKTTDLPGSRQLPCYDSGIVGALEKDIGSERWRFLCDHYKVQSYWINSINARCFKG